MKFKFVNKAKDLSPADISAKMNFTKVAQSAKALSSAKLSAGMLKLGSTTLTTVAVSTAVVVTAAVVLITNPGLLKSQEEGVPIEEVFESEIPLSQEPVFTIEKPEPTQDKSTTEAIVKPVEKKESPIAKQSLEPQEEVTPTTDEEKNGNVEIKDAEEENIFIAPRPLPSIESFYSFIDEELNYPVEYLEDPIKGIVKVRFTINKQGKAVNFKTNKSLGLVFDQEAIRVLKKYQNWQPASLNGQAVEYNMKISIRFETK